MQTSRFLFAGILTVVGSLVALPGCGDDDDGGTSGTGTTTTSGTGTGGAGGGTGGGGEGGDGGEGGGGDGGGGGAPDVSCASYCELVMANCTDDLAQYGSQASCEAYCADLPEGTAGDTTGNSLACRAYHAGEAATNAMTHCIHAGPGGGEVCGSPVESFCLVAPEACPDVFADTAVCEAEAANFDADTLYAGPDSTGNTLACRLYHLTEAAANAETHCPHIGEGSPVCM
ncbi:hypothetical protein WME76_27980 [Sorangium sp. So ce119]|uniref:hypothetical protein n=1 Tax=Sorangium sp. So ce119 TaxID=3133279 RepID=UPI003F5FEE32